jgi:hypothetical protein
MFSSVAINPPGIKSQNYIQFLIDKPWPVFKRQAHVAVFPRLGMKLWGAGW